MRHISNPNTTSRTPNTNTADKLHQINSPFHQKACHAPAMKSKEEHQSTKKNSTPQRRTQKPQVADQRPRHLNKKKGRTNTARPLNSHHKGTLNKDNPSTPQPSRRNISQSSTFHMEQTTAIITTHTTPSPQAPQRYAPPRGGAATENLHPSPRRQT